MGIDQGTCRNLVVEDTKNRNCVVYRNNVFLDAVVMVEQTTKAEYGVGSLEWIADRCCRTMIEEFPQYAEEEEFLVKRSFLLSLRRMIEGYMERTGLPKESCSATVLSVCVDWKRGLYCAFQLGNGIIIANGATPETVFYPFNFRRNRSANTTIAEEALLDLQFARGSLGNVQEFVLLPSDRYSYPLHMKEILDKIRSEVCGGKEERNWGIAILSREGHGYEQENTDYGERKKR